MKQWGDMSKDQRKPPYRSNLAKERFGSETNRSASEITIVSKRAFLISSRKRYRHVFTGPGSYVCKRNLERQCSGSADLSRHASHHITSLPVATKLSQNQQDAFACLPSASYSTTDIKSTELGHDDQNQINGATTSEEKNSFLQANAIADATNAVLPQKATALRFALITSAVTACNTAQMTEVRFKLV